MERRLAAIVAGDIVSYSKAMEEDEAGTFAALRFAFETIIKPSLLAHGSRTFKSTGDGFLATFASVNEALDAVIEIQAGFAESPLAMRIGVNLGDVLEADGDIFGDGVNVAARLEAMADPGSIFVSAPVVRSADRDRRRHFVRLGRRKAKNITEGLDVYAVNASARSRLGRWIPATRLGRSATIAAIVATLGFLGLAVADHGTLRSAVEHVAAQTLRLAGVSDVDFRPTVAVLPFDNMSWEQDETYFVDGLTEDIITGLARYPELQVIARNSTYALRDEAADVRRTGELLGAGYIVEGSARREGDRLRVVAQLIDLRTGAHLWSQSYDRGVDDIFAVQTDLTTQIVANLVSYVRQSEVAEAVSRPTGNLRAYDLLLKGRSLFKHGSRDGEALLQARGLYQQALELDPSYATARAQLGLTYIVDASELISRSAASTDLGTGLSEARQAIRLDPNLAFAYQVLSFGLVASKDYEGGIQAAQQAVNLNPNDPDSLMALAKAQVRFGDYGEAVANAGLARRLHPLAPPYYTYVHGQALYAAGKRSEADEVLKECLLRAPDETGCLLIRTALLVDQGQLEEAKSTMSSLRTANPDFSLSQEREYMRFGRSPLMESFLSSLARAQAPESA